MTCDDPDFHPTGLVEDADGSLLVIDTGGWFRIGCPTSQVAKPHVTGGVYRIRRKDAPKVDDPRGLRLAWDKMDASGPAKAAGRPALRRARPGRGGAGEEGRRRRAAAGGAPGRTPKAPREGRLNAVWALTRIDGAAAPRGGPAGAGRRRPRRAAGRDPFRRRCSATSTPYADLLKLLTRRRLRRAPPGRHGAGPPRQAGRRPGAAGRPARRRRPTAGWNTPSSTP